VQSDRPHRRADDIHCGGKDHIPIHHSNEIAQAQACYGTKLSNYWMHGYFLETDKAKMSKSSGEFLRTASLLERGYDPLSYRFLCLLAHYRSDITFSWENLDGATTALTRLREAYYEWDEGGKVADDYQQRFLQCVNDDLNTSQAIALVWELVKNKEVTSADKKATLDWFDQVLGLNLAQWQPAAEEAVPDDILKLAEARQTARAAKDWAAADAARDELAAQGYEVIDTPEGFQVKKK